MRILNSIDAIVLVPPVGRGVSRVAEVRTALVGDALEVMARYIGAFIIVGVVDVTPAGMRDGPDLTDAIWRRRSANVTGSVPTGTVEFPRKSV